MVECRLLLKQLNITNGDQKYEGKCVGLLSLYIKQHSYRYIKYSNIKYYDKIKHSYETLIYYYYTGEKSKILCLVGA